MLRSKIQKFHGFFRISPHAGQTDINTGQHYWSELPNKWATNAN